MAVWREFLQAQDLSVFNKILEKAAYENRGRAISDHFVDANNMLVLTRGLFPA